MNIISSDYEMLWHSVWPQYEYRSLWPIFHGPVILLYISKIIWHMHIIFPDNEMVWHNLWPQYDCKALWPIFHSPVILLYIWKPIWHMNIILPDYEMVWHNYSPQYECKSLWPIFHGPVILLYILKIIWHMHIIFSDYEMYDTTFDLNMNVSHCDLHFMVQWVCPISERSFGKWNIILPDYKILWHNVWPQYECRPIFYGPVIFYMWKTIWHINIILPDYELVLHNIWPEYWVLVSMTYV